MADQNFLVIDSNQEIQLVATGGGTLTFTSDDLPEGISLSSDGKLTGFSVDGTYTINVKCSSNYGTEASAVITVYVNQTLQKTQNNLTSNTSSDFVVVYDQGNNSSAYKAMDGDLSTYSSSSFSTASTSNFRIDFSQPIITKYIQLKLRDNGNAYSYYLQASTDGNTWVRIYDQIIPNTFDGMLAVNLDTPYQYYRLVRANSGYYHYICEIIFYYKYVENYLSAKDQTINAKLGEQFTYQIEYLNYSETPVQFYIDSELPEGIYFDETTGTFSGSSSVQITKNLTVTLTNTYKTIQITITLVVSTILTTPHNLTSNTSDSRYIVSLSDNLESAKRHAWNAMDGSLDQDYGCAHTGIGSNKWWKIQFNEAPVYIIDFVWTNREMNNVGSVGGAGGTSLILQGSNNNTTWIDVYPFNIDTTNGKIFEFAVNSQQAYKYWRIFQKASNYLIIGQIEFRYSLQ